jgi:PadR family transcriptional regulator PadR
MRRRLVYKQLIFRRSRRGMGFFMAAISGDILKGNTLTLILSLLEEQPMYGFQISREVERRSEGTLRFREGLLYPALHQLEKEGLVESEWKVSTQGPRRKYYRLTMKGTRQADRLRKKWTAFAGAVNQVLGGRAGG